MWLIYRQLGRFHIRDSNELAGWHFDLLLAVAIILAGKRAVHFAGSLSAGFSFAIAWTSFNPNMAYYPLSWNDGIETNTLWIKYWHTGMISRATLLPSSLDYVMGKSYFLSTVNLLLSEAWLWLTRRSRLWYSFDTICFVDVDATLQCPFIALVVPYACFNTCDCTSYVVQKLKKKQTYLTTPQINPIRALPVWAANLVKRNTL